MKTDDHETENTQGTGGQTRHAQASTATRFYNSDNEISKLIARWNYLEADRKYQATIAATKEDAKNIFDYRHGAEKDEIRNKLANLVPQNFREVFELFDFATAAIVEKLMTGKRLKRKSGC